MNIESFEIEAKRHKGVMDILIGALKTQIIGLPDNQNIKRLPDGARGFIMNFNNLNDNWAPTYYNFKKQYEILLDELSKCHPEDVIERMETVIKDKQIKLSSSGIVFRFHPEVIKHLMSIGEYRWKSIAVWPRGTCSTSDGKDISHDFHSSQEEAEGVCRMLHSHGFGGYNKCFPIQTKVELCKKG